MKAAGCQKNSVVVDEFFGRIFKEDAMSILRSCHPQHVSEVPIS